MRRWFMVGCGMLLLAGCVRETIPPGLSYGAPLVYTVQNGLASLSWPSHPGDVYTVFYADASDNYAAWKPLPAATHLRGTGKRMTAEDESPPGQPRAYRLQTDPAAAR